MNSKQISDAMNALDDDILSSAYGARSRRSTGRSWLLRAAAMAATIALVIAGVAVLPGEEPMVPVADADVITLAEAKYPALDHYPDPQDYLDAEGFQDYAAYWEAVEQWQKLRQAQTKNWDADMTDFLHRFMGSFLTGSGNENLAYSPSNIYLALGMLAEVSSGYTQAQLLEVLGQESMEDLRRTANAMWEAAYMDDGTHASILGSSVWLDDEAVVDKRVMQQLADTYRASSFSGNMGSNSMNEQLRSWINKQTKDLLKSESQNIQLDADQLMALVTTIYFKAPWSNQFSELATYAGKFGGIFGTDCMFMTQTLHTWYYDGDGFTAVAMEMEAAGHMWFILPDAGVSMDEVAKSQEVAALTLQNPADAGCVSRKIHFTMPKLDLTCSGDISEKLQHMGVETAFETLGPGSDMFLGKVDHAVRMLMDEEGCEAAAYTIMYAYGTSLQPEKVIEFTLDRPFLYVAANDVGIPLFTGIVNTPN